MQYQRIKKRIIIRGNKVMLKSPSRVKNNILHLFLKTGKAGAKRNDLVISVSKKCIENIIEPRSGGMFIATGYELTCRSYGAPNTIHNYISINMSSLRDSILPGD